MQLRRAPPCHCRRCTALLSRSRMQRSLQCSLSPVQQGEATRLLLPPFRLSHAVPPRQRSPLLYCHARSLLGPGARTSTKMQLSGLVFLLLGSAACFDVDIAPPKLGLRRLFRKPYRGPICVIEIVGAELTPIANCATARSLYPVAQPRPLSLAPGCAATLDEPLSRTKPSTNEAQMKTPTCVSVRLRHAGFDWRSPLGLLSKGTPDLRVEWKHGSASGDTQVEDVPNPNPN